MKSSLLSKLRHYKRWIFRGNVNNPIDRLRLYGYVVCTVLTLVGCLLHFVGIMGIRQNVLLTISALWFCSDTVLLLLFLTKHLGLAKSFTVAAFLSQAFESVRIFYLSYTQTITSQQFYINEFICFSILLLVTIGFFYKATFTLTLFNLATILVCRPFIPGIINSMTISFFILADTALCAYSFVSVAFVRQITTENREVKGKYNSFLSFLRISDSEATTLIQLICTAPNDKQNVESMVSQLKDETKANLIKVARLINNERMAQEDKISKYFPQLSPTELSVCQLVVSGHSQKDIARILGKTENNISTVRGNIRRKLDLDSAQDLRAYLTSTIGKNAA